MPQVILRREHISAKTLKELEEEYGKSRGCPLYKAIRQQHPEYPIAFVGARCIRNIDGSWSQISGWNGWADVLRVFQTGKSITVEF